MDASCSGTQAGEDGCSSEPGQRHSPFKQKLLWLWAAAKQGPGGPGQAQVGLAFVILAAVVYGVLYFGLGSAFLPGHAAFDTLLLWVAAHIGAIVAYYLYLPHVIGMLAAGILMKNIPWGAIDAFPSSWGNQIRAAALATIFLRCGLELDFGTMRRYKNPATRLSLIPGLAEAFYDGGIASVVFGMPITLGFTLGFIMKAVGPGLVVPAMFKLQKRGLGKDQGIPSTVVIAASFDDIVAITGYSIFSSIAISGSENKAWNIAEGPLQVIFGILGGIIAGVALGCTKLFDSKIKRLVGIYGSCLLIMFFLGHFDMKAGGALGALVVGLIASNAWEKGFPRFASLGPSFEYSPYIERWMSLVWLWIMEPMLFVTIGSSIYFKTLASGTIPKALIIICSGLAIRVVMTCLAMGGMGYTWRERAFFAVAWTPKATVQAALSATPLAMIQSTMVGAPDYAEWEAWGNDILTTGIFTIIVCGTLGVMAIHFTAPLLLKPSKRMMEQSAAREKGTSEQGGVASIEATDLGVGGDAARVPPGLHMRRPASAQSSHAGTELHAVVSEDYELIAEYIDAIRHLIAAAQAERPDREEVRRLSNMVLHIQERIETEVGRREPSVREMFRAASFLASQRTLRVHPRTATPPPPLGGSEAALGTRSSAGSLLHESGQNTGAGAGAKQGKDVELAERGRPPSSADQV